jgi:hypothetical protein
LEIVEDAQRRLPESAWELEDRRLRLLRKTSRRAARSVQLDLADQD